jgi:hypothetical protein
MRPKGLSGLPMRIVLVLLLATSLFAVCCSVADQALTLQTLLPSLTRGIPLLMAEPRPATPEEAFRFGAGAPGLAPAASSPVAEKPAAPSTETAPRSRAQMWIILGVLALMLALGAFVKSRVSRGKPEDEPPEESA